MKYLIPVTILVLILGASGAWLLFGRSAGYGVATPKRGDITEAVYGLGKVKAKQRYEVIVGVARTVSRLFVKEGDTVEKGASLIELESQAFFRAPFAGTVTYIKAYKQEMVVPNSPILRLEDLNDRYIELSLEQQAAIRVKKGMGAKVSLESIRGKALEGEVVALFPRNDEFLAHVKVIGLEGNVLPGMTADVTIEVGKIENALLVPISAIRNGMVTVRRNGSWRKEKLEIGHVGGQFAEVLNGTLDEQSELRVPAGSL